MQIDYRLTVKDLENITLLLGQRYITNNRQYTLQRVLISAVFAIAVCAYMINWFQPNTSDLLAILVLGGFLFLLTLFVYPRISHRNAYLALHKAIKEGKFQAALGPHTISLAAESYIHTIPSSELRIQWSAIPKVEVLPDYLLVYHSVKDMDMDIIPRRAFQDQAAYETFAQTLTSYQQAAH